MMERLTKRIGNSVDFSNEKVGEFLTDHKAGVKALFEKLADYEDLEEQGLLIRTRCKIGDKAYHIIKDDIAVPPIYISEHEITDVSVKAVYFADDWWTFEEMQGMNAFLSKEEAEKALAEMNEQEE